MQWNVPIITFLQRTWMLLLAAIVFNLLALNDAVFKNCGALVYIPAICASVYWIALLVIHLFFRETVDLDAHNGIYLADWRSMTPEQRVRYATIIRIGTIIGLCILCAGLARGEVPDQEARWNAAQINPRSSIALDADVSLYVRLASRYQEVTDMRKNGVPSPVIFCLHQRESSGSFLCSPAQGDPLTHRSIHVPRGRIPNVDPPYSFGQSAEDSYYVIDRLDTKDWCYIASRLQAIESFNGLGYQRFHPDVPSPYLWAGTTVEKRGKYTGDGRFDRTALDRQLGVCAILKRMEQRGIYVFCTAL